MMIYISICIPTKNRFSNLKETIESIISDGVDYSDFQIVVSDNSDIERDFVEEYCNYLIASGVNVIYFKNPESGFYNSITALLLGDGEFLKLNNDYSKFKKGGFKKLVEQVKGNIDKKPMIFFSNGGLNAKYNNQHFIDLNSFLNAASYLTTWSSAFSIWKQDLDVIPHDTNSVDKMFPHTSLLLNHKRGIYMINNDVCFENLFVAKKGGYNIFYNFCILYLSMINIKFSQGTVKYKTYMKVKWEMFYKFIIPWYYRTIVTDQGYTFDSQYAKKNILKAYGFYGLIQVIIISHVRLLMKSPGTKK